MLDDKNRLTISLGLIEHSNLKGAKKVFIAIESKELLLIPESGPLKEGIRIYWFKTIEEKGRLTLPDQLVKISSDWTPYLLNGEIRVEPKPRYEFE